MRIYLDSNVFISLMNLEIGRGIRGLFVEAEAFFRKAKDERHTLLLSSLFFREVENKIFLNKNEVIDYIVKLGVLMEIISIQEKTVRTNEFTSKGLHHLDAVHVALARAVKCDCIVTFNKRDFDKINDLIPIFEPSDLL